MQFSIVAELVLLLESKAHADEAGWQTPERVPANGKGLLKNGDKKL